jgi:hypothetical protein
MSIQRILCNNRNAVTSALLTASAVTPAAAVFPGKSSRKGSGSVRLCGSYTGHDDAGFEIRVTSGQGSGRVSSPVFAGVGSGRMIDLAAAGVPAQTVEVELASLGTVSRSAYLDFYGAQLVARAEGAAGNNVNLSVREELAVAASNYSLLSGIKEGEDTFSGEEWEWSGITRTLSPDGTLPADCPRIRFQGDSTVYRQYREYTSEGWVYHITPAPAAAIPAGARVSVVTGARTVTVTDGSVTEIYPGVVTLYDLLSALRLRSGLITVQGVVSRDLTPGGMASLDLPLRTGAKANPPAISGGWPELNGFADTLEVKADAPTEIVTLDYQGDGLWGVRGTVSGSLPAARTGAAYADPASPVSFTIPAAAALKAPPGLQAQSGAARITSIAYQNRDDDETEPPVIIAASRLGANATPRNITATYKKNRKSANCEVIPLPVVISNYCLGLPEGGSAMDLDPAYASRLTALYQWRHDFISGNTGGSAGIVRYKVSYYSEPHTVGDVTYGGETVVTYFPTYDRAYSYIVEFMTYEFYTNWTGPTPEPVTSGSGSAGYLAAASDIAWMERCFSLLLISLEQVYPFPSVLPMWDSLKNDVMSDLAALMASAGDDIREAQEGYLTRYSSRIDLIYLAAGIVPGKSDGAGMGAGCWRDMDTAYYWELSDGYAPAFTDEVYYSTTFDGENTREFAFVIACKCPQHLKEGDRLAISIGGASGASSGSSQAAITIPVIAGSARYLAGGASGDDTLVWDVRGSVTAFPALSMAADPARFQSGGLSFTLAKGGIPFALGDRFTFSVEGGEFAWRKDGGPWSAALPIGASYLADGLSVVFAAGPYPSFVEGDLFRFTARQPHSPANVATPSPEQWRWGGAAATLTMDFGTETDIDAVALARHDLPAAASLTVEFSVDGAEWTPPAALSCGRPVIAWIPDEAVSARYLRLAVNAAGAIGWVFAGRALTTELTPESITLRRQYDLVHGPREGAVYQGKGAAGLIEWRNFISKAELDDHVTAIEYCKVNGNLPLVVVPHYLHPEEAMLVTVETDGIDIVDELQFHPDDAAQRMLSLSLPLAPVLQ